MSRFDCNALVRRLSHFDFPFAIVEAEREAADVQVLSSRTRGAPQARKDGSAEYLNFIRGLLYWLKNRQRPAGLSDEEMTMIRPLAECLIKKGQMKPEALEVFGGPA